MLAKVVIQFLLFGLFLGALIFWPAGTLAYPGGWALFALMVGGGALITVWLSRHDPKLLRERMSPPIQRDQKTWDRVFMLFLMITFVAWLGFSVWDAARRGFAAMPPWAQVLGGLGVAFYMLAAWLTFRENSFASPVVKIGDGQKVIDTGPYSVVRHPMYAGALFLFAGAPFLLGSWWGLLGSCLLVLGVAWRAMREEGVLRAELPGYADYAARVRWRFVPLIW